MAPAVEKLRQQAVIRKAKSPIRFGSAAEQIKLAREADRQNSEYLNSFMEVAREMKLSRL